MSKAVIILESQPPHLGQFIAVKNVLAKHDEVVLCLIDKPIIMQTDKMSSIWKTMLYEYGTKIYTSTLDFTSVSRFPEELENADAYYVSDKHVFVHLNSLGYPVELLGHVRGYTDVFIRSAYRQGLSYDYLIDYLSK